MDRRVKTTTPKIKVTVENMKCLPFFSFFDNRGVQASFRPPRLSTTKNVIH